jgi:hypothetical protein
MTSSTHVAWHSHSVSRDERERKQGHKGCVVWFTGLSGCGKSTIANLVDHKLHTLGVHSFVLDGDNIRHGLNAGPQMPAIPKVCTRKPGPARSEISRGSTIPTSPPSDQSCDWTPHARRRATWRKRWCHILSRLGSLGRFASRDSDTAIDPVFSSGGVAFPHTITCVYGRLRRLFRRYCPFMWMKWS